MKKIQIKVAFLILVSCITSYNPPVVYAESYEKYNLEDAVRIDNIIWKYKMVNGKIYKRQYNSSTGEWIGNWIPA